MIHLRITILLLIAVALPSCATSRRNPLTARKEAYKRLASFLEPGMTRRQVYALLPPRRPPTTTEANPFNIIVGRGPAASRLQNELHPLDPDFDLNVYYILAKPKGRVPTTPSNSKPATLGSRNDLLGILERVTNPTDARNSRAVVHGCCVTTSPNAIDELLFGRSWQWTPKIVRSKEDMDDRLSTRPTVVDGESQRQLAMKRLYKK